MRVERDGLLLFALAVLIVGGVLVGQALARAVSAGAADLPTWRAIGADRRIAVRALVLPAVLTAVVGVVVGASASPSRCPPRFPISQARRYDLDLGYSRRLAGARRSRRSRSLVAVLAIASRVRALGRRAGGGRPTRRPRPSGGWAAQAGLPPALAIGSRLAVEPGRGRRAVPVRSALIGAIVGVLGVVGCFTFRAGLADAAASPQRSGIVWNFVVGSGEGPSPPKHSRRSRSDRDVAGVLHAVWVRDVRINGVADTDVGDRHAEGRHAPVVLDGRAPSTADEIAFGPGDAARLEVARR